VTTAEVWLWDARVGVVSLLDGEATAEFRYDPEFVARGVELAPLTMPLRGPGPYRFPELDRSTFHGLPGLLANALPDRFGTLLVDSWLAAQGRSFDAVQRLSFLGARGMGALEFRPDIGPQPAPPHELQLDRLVSLASEALSDRERLVAAFTDPVGAAADLLAIGTSAGGARAKAIVAYDERTGVVRSAASPDCDDWLIKFDGVTGNKDKEVEDPKGYGAIELGYHFMALDCGIEMTECRLLEEGGRRHFMTRRFDRVAGAKLHMQCLGAMAHYDFNVAGAHSYEEAFAVMRRLGLGPDAAEQQFRRMVFNVIGRNQDDHVKNIAFLMDRDGAWRLSPAFDVTYAYQPTGAWTSRHQMSINGKRDDFTIQDLVAVAEGAAGLSREHAHDIVAHTLDVVRRWPDYAARAGVTEAHTTRVHNGQRLDLA
jgi:serine/threonine-protein kinase HipA